MRQSPTTTIRHQPCTQWADNTELRPLWCVNLCARITPWTCQYNQRIAEYVKSRLDRQGSIITLKSTGSHRRSGFSAHQLSRFKACGECSRCQTVNHRDIDNALKACAEAIKAFESVPLHYFDDELKRARKRENYKKQYQRKKEKMCK